MKKLFGVLAILCISMQVSAEQSVDELYELPYEEDIVLEEVFE